ncbi:hypothetical protein UP09_31015 [Bradyrhizobium sp. LTSP885]|uniref:hypothetical protein n=1 Tax=Bradyrhizobium sp. LTSP885 TaxID=1619232 RepID=UPI0005CA6EE6|nr:hypothetical protein [Bradyrhizobium sp. LTSP885]KJC35657.1 hypothetical protein UP09_31015 [Bradyrhizobium sp. LTSP885]
MADAPKDLLDAIENRFPRVTASRSFIVAIVTALGIGFAVSHFLSSTEVSALKQQVELYKAKLQVGSPDEALKKLKDLEDRVQAIQPKPDRQLSQEQKKSLAASLAPIAKDITQLWIFYEGTGEEARFANDFAAVLRDLKIPTFGPMPGYGSLSTDRGVLVGLRDPRKPSALALRFIDALRQGGIDASTTYWAGDQGDIDFDLFVAGQ